MAKRYVVTEESGCGCGSFFFGAIALMFISPFIPFLAGILAVVAIIWLIIYIPKYRVKKQQQREYDELAERERQLDLQQKIMDLEAREKELRKKQEDFTDSKDNSWDDF